MPAPLYTRRQSTRLSLAALLSLGLWPGSRTRAAEEAGKAAGAFRFSVINDTHFMEAACEPWHRAAIETVKKAEPKFLLHCGDVANDGTAEQLAMAARVLNGVGIPSYTVPGNHDHQADDDRTPYLQNFPGRLNYHFTHEGWQFVGLDTSWGKRFTGTLIQPETFRWLAENLPKLDPAAPTVVFTHFPLGDGINMRPLNADALLTTLLQFNIAAVFCGHYHGYTDREWRASRIVTGRCCARVRDNHDKDPKKGWWQCEAAGGKIERTFIEFTPPKV